MQPWTQLPFCPYVVFLLQKPNLCGQELECLQMCSPGVLRNSSDALNWLSAKVLNVFLEEDVGLFQPDAFDRDNGEKRNCPGDWEKQVCVSVSTLW